LPDAVSEDSKNTRIVLGILESVERNGAQSQRVIAQDLGIALGLVNAYLKRCIKKGLVKVGEAPARRYFYYLTPLGFTEKSRLTVEYLSYSFGFFRQARMDCAKSLQAASAAGCRQMILVGKSDLAEIAAICALESGIKIVAVVDRQSQASIFVGVPLLPTLSDISEPFDGALVTDLNNPIETHEWLLGLMEPQRVFVPELIRLRREQAT
jgi:DNA-binding MarR family transcriptional regulator